MNEKKRASFTFRLSTALVTMIFAGGLVWILCGRIQNAGVTVELRRIEFADPVADATGATAKKDFHLVGIFGLGLSVPGAESEHELQEQFGVHPVVGTSDCIESDEQARLQGIAFRYAKKYNRVVLKAIAKEKNSKR